MKTTTIQAQIDTEVAEQASAFARELGFKDLKQAYMRFFELLATKTPVVVPKVQNDEENISLSDWYVKALYRDIEDTELMLREKPNLKEKYTARTAKELIEKLDSNEDE